jgi:hypothetical protein
VNQNNSSKRVRICDAKDLLMVSLNKFYRDPAHIRALLEVVEPGDFKNNNCKEENHISLRLIDWFVTNYAKKYNVMIISPFRNPTDPTSRQIHVYTNYRTQLRAYTKQLFDPFRRRSRIKFVYAKDKSIDTTIGQLNMFRWMIEYQLLDHIRQNAKMIEQDMINTLKEINKEEKTISDKTTSYHPVSIKKVTVLKDSPCVVRFG